MGWEGLLHCIIRFSLGSDDPVHRQCPECVNCCLTEELVLKLGIQDKPKVIDLTRKEATVDTLTETRIDCHRNEKVSTKYLLRLQNVFLCMCFSVLVVLKIADNYSRTLTNDQIEKFKRGLERELVLANRFVSFYLFSQWGTVNAEIKVPSAENPELCPLNF